MSIMDSIIRLGVAALLGGIIGLEREISHKPAGLRTNILICVGSALFMVISRHIPTGTATGDPGRIAAQVVTGIGFLGAGVIIQSRGSVLGLTTGATIFAVAAVGLAAGAGYWGPAVVGTAVVLLSLVALSKVERILGTRVAQYRYTIIAADSTAVLSRIESALQGLGVAIDEFSYERSDEGDARLTFSITASEGQNKLLQRQLIQLEGIKKVVSPRESE